MCDWDKSARYTIGTMMYSQDTVVKKCNSHTFMKSFWVLPIRDGQSKHTQRSGRKLMWYYMQKKRKAKTLHLRQRYVVFKVQDEKITQLASSVPLICLTDSSK